MFLSVCMFQGVSCSVQMGRILTFFIGRSSCFCRVATTVDEDKKMALQCVVALLYKGVWIVIHSY